MASNIKSNLVVELELCTPNKSKYKGAKYNRFEILTDGDDKALAEPHAMGLNTNLLQYGSTSIAEDVRKRLEQVNIKQPRLNNWCGYHISELIKKYNQENKVHGRCMKLIYDVRHGEADHNAWKKLLKVPWAEKPEYRRLPTFKYEEGGKDYGRFCIVDPPLTAGGSGQAREAKTTFAELRARGFPMPKRGYISPLLRAMQTAELALDGIGLSEKNRYVYYGLREEQTGNCADILLDEFMRPKNFKLPPLAGTKPPRTKLFMEDRNTVKGRAEKLWDHLFRMEESDCLVRVTHSLLIKNSIQSLVGGEAKRKVLSTFMLGEGGIFAYVVVGEYKSGSGAVNMEKEFREGEVEKARGSENNGDKIPENQEEEDRFKLMPLADHKKSIDKYGARETAFSKPPPKRGELAKPVKAKDGKDGKDGIPEAILKVAQAASDEDKARVRQEVYEEMKKKRQAGAGVNQAARVASQPLPPQPKPRAPGQANGSKTNLPAAVGPATIAPAKTLPKSSNGRGTKRPVAQRDNKGATQAQGSQRRTNNPRYCDNLII